MLSKEEIEEAKECLQETIQNTYAEGKATKLNNLSEYIEQLETKEQKLIEMLEKDIETAKKENTPYVECKKESRMYLMNIGKIQAEEKILKIVKGEKQ